MLNLKALNVFIWIQTFYMYSIIASSYQGDFIASVGSKDAYLHVLIFPAY